MLAFFRKYPELKVHFELDEFQLMDPSMKRTLRDFSQTFFGTCSSESPAHEHVRDTESLDFSII